MTLGKRSTQKTLVRNTSGESSLWQRKGAWSSHEGPSGDHAGAPHPGMKMGSLQPPTGPWPWFGGSVDQTRLTLAHSCTHHWCQTELAWSEFPTLQNCAHSLSVTSRVTDETVLVRFIAVAAVRIQNWAEDTSLKTE